VNDVSDVKVMSSTDAVIFAITWVVSNYNIRTESEFKKKRTETEPRLKNLFRTSLAIVRHPSSWHTITFKIMSGLLSQAKSDFDETWCECCDGKGCLRHGWRPRGRPRKRWLDNITEDCEELNLTIHQAPRLANDRVKWRNTAATRADGAWGLVPGLGRAWVGDPCIKLFGYLLFHASHMPKVGQGVPVILH